MLDNVFKDTKEKMGKNVDMLKRHLAKMRTGRATPSLVSDIKVECYGERMPLSQLATISVPESGLIVIQPWDPTILKGIENSIDEKPKGHAFRIRIGSRETKTRKNGP